MSEIPSGTPENTLPTAPPIVKQTSRYWPFFLLFSIFALLIGLALVSLTSNKRKEESVQQLELQLKMALMPEAVSSISSAPSTNAGSQKTALEKVIKEAEEFPQSEHAAKVRLSAEYEVGKKPSEQALNLLRTSTDSADKDFARIYAAEKIDRADAEKWGPTEKAFSSELARAHAFQKAGDKSARSRLLSMQTYGPVMAVIVLGIAALGLGAVVLIGFIVMARRFDWPFPPLIIPSAGEGDRYAVRASVAMLLYIIVGVVLALTKFQAGSPMLANAVMFVGWIGGTILFLHVPLWGTEDTWSRVIGVKDRVLARLLFGTGGFFANLPILAGAATVVSLVAPFLPEATHPVTTELASGKPDVIIMSFVMAAIMAPIAEETIFRGLIMRALMGLFGKPWPAIILQGFLFAAIHPQGPAGWLPLMAVGCMCGWLTWRSGSLLPAMILHFVHNSVILIASTLFL